MTDQDARWILMFIGKSLAVSTLAVAVLAIVVAVRGYFERD